MLDLDYGSGSEDDDVGTSATATVTKAHTTTKPTLATSLPPPKGSSLALPPPAKANTSASSGPMLLSHRAKKVKKIAIGLPELSGSRHGGEDDEDPRPAAKKPRLESGAGMSSLLSMLPAPKVKNPIPPPALRVLGGGGRPGLVFNTLPDAAALPSAQDDDADIYEDAPALSLPPPKASSSSILPPSLGKGRSNINVEDIKPAPKPTYQPPPPPATDFFSLGTTSTSHSASSQIKSGTGLSSTAPLLSSAPKIDDFKPPEPTQNDTYPGYYQLPSGTWAAHDPTYYKSFYDKWKKEYDAHVRSLERGERGFEDYDEDAAGEVDAAAEMERAKVQVKELEERKALTKGDQDELDKPRMNIQGAKLGGRARSRHQLTTLLTEAYQNREVLEEKIAMAKRNRKEAGQKYGF